MPHRRKKYIEENRKTRDLILDITEKVIAEHGVDGLRLKDIADQVGIQLPSLYAHFSGRKKLLEALADRLMDEIIKIYLDLSGLPPREALLASAERSIDFFLKHRGYARLLMSDLPAATKDSVFAGAGEKYEKVQMIVRSIISRGVEQNVVRDMSADLFLAFRMGLTLFPLFIYHRGADEDMVSDTDAINRIKREANRQLAHFIAVV